MAKAKAQPSKRSRAARRATSPSINTDKSLKDVQLPQGSKTAGERPSVLAVHHSAGVQKKIGHRKSHMSAKARKRREKGMEMAEAVMERTSIKVKQSLTRARTIDQRRKGWDAINKEVDQNGEGDEDSDEEEEEEVMDVEHDNAAKTTKGASASAPASKKSKKQKARAMLSGGAWESDEDIAKGVAAAAAEPANVDDDLDEIL